MIKKGFILILYVYIIWAYTQNVTAQQLPSIPIASNIKTGVLDNGVQYYLVKNDTDKGLVDIALVQKTGYYDEDSKHLGQSVVVSRSSITDLPRFTYTTPFGFMSRKCIFPNSQGYVQVNEDNTIYKFDNLITTGSKEVLDSTLLMVFDILAVNSIKSTRYSTNSAAIIVVGDIDQGAILNKMNMLALLVPRKANYSAERNYKWQNKALQFKFTQPYSPQLVSVTASYNYARTPYDKMNTMQSLASDKIAGELCILIENRLKNALQEADIPYANVTCTHTSSSQTSYDEQVITTITTSRNYLVMATNTLGQVLSSIGKTGSVVTEYKGVQNQFRIMLGQLFDKVVGKNSNYVNKCISSFLYNAPLSSVQYNYDFFDKKELSPEQELSFLNSYSKAILGSQNNLTLLCSADSSLTLKKSLIATFNNGWNSTDTDNIGLNTENIETKLFRKTYPKIKLKAQNIEPMTNGKVFSFANGVKVIYKEAGRKNYFYYTLLLKSGFAQANNISPLNRAYLSDILSFNDIAGIKGDNFLEFLNSKGISIDTKVSISDFTISGNSPNSELDLVLKSLLAIGYERKVNTKMLSFYNQCKNLEIDNSDNTEAYKNAILDSLLCPSMPYTSIQRKVNLNESFAYNADKFYNTAFSKVNDGVLLIVGNLDEDKLIKTLSKYLGGFKSSTVSSYRSRLADNSNSGYNVLEKTGNSDYFSLQFSTPINYTAENYMAANIAAIAMREALMNVASHSGWTCSIGGNFVMFPQERFNLIMHYTKANPNGLPASMVQETNVDKLRLKINKQIYTIGEKGINIKQFNAYKALFTNMFTEDINSPKQIQKLLLLRYSYGKDLMTKYAEKLSSITLPRVNSILTDMANGAIMELVLQSHKGLQEQITEPKLQAPTLPQIDSIVYPTDTTGIADVYRQIFLKKSNN